MRTARRLTICLLGGGEGGVHAAEGERMVHPGGCIHAGAGGASMLERGGGASMLQQDVHLGDSASMLQRECIQGECIHAAGGGASMQWGVHPGCTLLEQNDTCLWIHYLPIISYGAVTTRNQYIFISVFRCPSLQPG